MKRIFFAAAMIAVTGGVYACSHYDADHDHTVPTDKEGGHTSPYPSCNAITQACHEFDVGEGPVHDCHELGHDSTSDEPCAAKKDACLALCVAEGGVDAGAADATDAARD